MFQGWAPEDYRVPGMGPTGLGRVPGMGLTGSQGYGVFQGRRVRECFRDGTHRVTECSRDGPQRIIGFQGWAPQG